MDKKELAKKIVFCAVIEFIILSVALFLNFRGVALSKQLFWLIPAIFICGIINAAIILEQVLVNKKEASSNTSEEYQKKSSSDNDAKI